MNVELYLYFISTKVCGIEKSSVKIHFNSDSLKPKTHVNKKNRFPPSITQDHFKILSIL